MDKFFNKVEENPYKPLAFLCFNDIITLSTLLEVAGCK